MDFQNFSYVWVPEDDAKLLGLVVMHGQYTSRQLIEALKWSDEDFNIIVQSLVKVGLLIRIFQSNGSESYKCPQQDAVRAWLQANHPEALLG